LIIIGGEQRSERRSEELGPVDFILIFNQARLAIFYLQPDGEKEIIASSPGKGQTFIN
jgi:hypothetical protein